MRINCLFICPDSVSLPRFFSYTYILLGMNIYICVNYVTTFSYISCILWGMYLLYIIFSSNIVIEIIINGVIDEDAYNFSIIQVLGFIILLSEFGSIQFYSFERYLRFIEREVERMRESNIELLRIVSMVLIIMHHFSVHGTFPFTPELTFNKVFLQVFGLGGKAGVVAFVMITGYFMVSSSFKLHKFGKLVGQI